MSLRKSALKMIALAGCAAGAFAQTSSSTDTHEIAFPPIGLAGSETAQINLVNVAIASSSGTAASAPEPSRSSTRAVPSSGLRPVSR